MRYPWLSVVWSASKVSRESNIITHIEMAQHITRAALLLAAHGHLTDLVPHVTQFIPYMVNAQRSPDAEIIPYME